MQITTGTSSASFLPDSSQQQPTSDTKPSKEKEIPESTQAPGERDESQSHQRAFAADHQKKLKTETRKEQSIGRKMCEKCDVKRQISAKEKTLSYSNEKTNHAHRPRHGRLRTKDHLSKTEHEQELKLREEAQRQVVGKNPSILGLRPEYASSRVLFDGFERGSLQLNKNQEKKSEATISEEAAKAIRLIDDHLPADRGEKGEENSRLPGQMLIKHSFPGGELLIGRQHANEEKPTKEIGPNGGDHKMSPTVQVNRKAVLIEQRVPDPLVGPNLEWTEMPRKKDANVDEASGPDQKRSQKIINQEINPTVDKTETKRKISAPSSKKVPRNSIPHRATEMHHKKERVGQPKTAQIMSRVSDRGPSRLEQVLSRQLHDQDPAKQARKVGPISDKNSTRILSRSGPVKGCHCEIIERWDPLQQKKPMRHQLTWKEMPRRTSQGTSTCGSSRTNGNCTSGSSVSRTSGSSLQQSRRITRGNLRERQFPNRVLSHRASENRLPPRRMMTHRAGPTTRKLALARPPRSHERSLTKPNMHGKPPKVGPLLHVGPGPTNSIYLNHQVEEERPEGRFRRLKNKLAIIFHHHHQHYHHHHLGHHNVENDHDDDGAKPPGDDHHHRSLWRYLGDVVHHTSKEEVKHVAEARGERAAGAVGKSVVRSVPGKKQQKGHVHALMERLLRHLWRSEKQQRKQLGKSGSRNMKKRKEKVQQHWWQRFHGRRGIKLKNGKDARLKLNYRRSKD